ncbi:MAG: hypothetical protein M1830_005138, partial [Pleopsidium flavum]
MLPAIELPFHPSATDCLSWSEDGELAVAAADHVHILVPKHKAGSNTNHADTLSLFESVRFRSNTFTSGEWPLQHPTSVKRFSIGEEESMSTVASLLWSPPGLAKYKRSVLGVLTTNLVLSIWCSTHDPKEPGSWKRVIVINKFIEKYFEHLEEHQEIEESTKRELVRLRKRIRAFSWSQACHLTGERGSRKRYEKWGVSILAVTNDNNEIIFVHILRPDGHISTTTKQWHAEVLGHFKASGGSEIPSFLAPSSLLAMRLNKQRFVPHLSWSPWTAPPPCEAGAILAYLTGDELRFRRVHLKVSRAPAAESTIGNDIFVLDTDEQDVDLNDEQLTEPIFVGPLRWYSKKSSGRLSLAVAARDRIYMISLPEHSINIRGATEHTFSLVHSSSQITGLTACSCRTVLRCDYASDGESQEEETTPYPLDKITGMTYCLDPDTSDLCLEVVTHLSNVQVFRHHVNPPVNAIPNATLTSHSRPQWQKNMADCLTKFNIRHDLGGLAFTKTWGLANLGNYAAACMTLHPGDMVEYTITSAERTTIVFGHQAAFNGGPSDSYLLPWTATPPVSRELSTICSEFVSSVLRFPRERFDKLCKRIVYAAACVGTFPPYVDRSVVDLSEDAFGWLANHDGVDMSEELVLCGRLRQRYDLDGSVGVGEAAKVNISARSREILQSKFAQGALEVCEICGEGIGWHSLQEARCALGHVYG